MAEAQTQQASATAGPETEITLGVLDAVEQNAQVTQRSVASELGIALGLANSYLKRCMRKGLIKVKQIPPNRYLYYLTPKGFAEKSRLTAEYLGSSFTFFRRARAQLEEAMAHCRDKGWRRVALYGVGELAEIAALCNAEFHLDLVLVAPGAARRVAGLTTVPDLEAAGAVDAAIVTDMARPQAIFDALKSRLAPERILTPRMLRISRNGNGRE
ncbi:MAG: winged helix-turn-helix transcriptional regulator [Alphaproteobacteria bacterium]